MQSGKISDAILLVVENVTSLREFLCEALRRLKGVSKVIGVEDGVEALKAIADEGSGFKPTDVPDPSADPLAHIKSRQKAGKRLGGYGIHLVRNLMDKVTWNERGNKVIAIKYLDKTP